MNVDDDNHGLPTYPIDPVTTALVSIDFQVAFGALEPVPNAAAALAAFIAAAEAWRAAGGTVFHVRTYYSADAGPGRLVDFAPGVVDALAEGAAMTAFYDGLVAPDDLILRKTRFSAVIGGDLVEQLAERGLTTVVVGGLTTPVCVQTTVDALQMTDHRVILLEDACASQPMGPLSADQAHHAAVERMRYVMAQVITAQEFIAQADGIAARRAQTVLS
jgi:nicotinamidase-related amidase